MAVTTEEERLRIVRKALGHVDIKALEKALSQTKPDETGSYPLVEAFSALPLGEQFLALGRAGVTLDEIGYGLPSEATIAQFGPDGKMRDPNQGHGSGATYES